MADEKFKITLSPDARERLIDQASKIGEAAGVLGAMARTRDGLAGLVEHAIRGEEEHTRRRMRRGLSRDELARLIQTKAPSEVARIAADHGVTQREFEEAFNLVSGMPLRDPPFAQQHMQVPRPQFEPPWDDGEAKAELRRRNQMERMAREVMDVPMEVRERVREQHRKELAVQVAALGDELDRMVLP